MASPTPSKSSAESGADAPDEPDRPVRITPVVGEVNVLEAAVGKRGCGKTTYQCARAYELSCEYGGAYVIGHSIGRRLPKRLPKELGLGDVELPIEYHRSIAELDRALHARPNRWHILAPQLPEEGGSIAEPEGADELLRYSIRLSAALRRRAWHRANPLSFWGKGKDTLGLECPPIIVIVDEGIALDAASTGQSARGNDKWFLQYIYSIRHLHIILLYSIQEPTSRSWRVLESATAVHVYQSRHRWAMNAIQACGASDEQMDEIAALEPYQRVTLR